MTRRTIRVYKSYNFVNKDPIIDVIRTVVEDEEKSYNQVSAGSGVSTQTLRNWFLGKTRRPQFCTIAAVARCCGRQMYVGDKRVSPIRAIQGGKNANARKEGRA